jgi:hypothetical protein
MWTLALLVTLLLLTACAGPGKPRPAAGVVAVSVRDGVSLVEGGTPVLFYRSRPEPGREAWRTHYVHPLHSVAGAVITEDGPQDHLHQRGVYWAWRRILVDGVRIADGWVGDNLVLEVDTPVIHAWPDGSAQVDTRVVWHVPVNGSPTPIIEELSTIRAYPAAGGHRRIDFDIRLRGLRTGVQLAGTDDDKGYGGFSLRFGHADQLDFASAGSSLQPAIGAVQTGDDVTLAWRAPAAAWPAAVRVACSVNGEPWRRWVLRRELSMQNCAFPGRQPFDVPQQAPLEIRASLVL